MLNDEEFLLWCRRVGLSQEARENHRGGQNLPGEQQNRNPQRHGMYATSGYPVVDRAREEKKERERNADADTRAAESRPPAEVAD